MRLYTIMVYISIALSFNILMLAHAPLRILFVVDKFPYEPRKYIDNQIVELLKAGHSVSIFADKIGSHSTYPLAEKYNFLDKTFYKDIDLQQNNEYDIVYCQFGGSGNRALKLIGKNKICGKLVVCFRGGDLTKRIMNNPRLYSELFKKADLLFPVCAHFRNILIAYGCDPDKIQVHYSSVNAKKIPFKERLQPTDNTSIRVVTVSRLIEYKGIEDSIKAVAKVIKTYPHIEYYIIGEGSQTAYLTELIHSLGMQHNITLVGYLNFDEVLEELNKSHFYLMTPYTPWYGEQEGIPNAIKEAMLAGLPIITTDHGGIPELVEDGISGFVVTERDVDAIAEKIIFLIENPHLWSIFGKAGSEYVKKYFDKKAINDRLLTLFYNLIAS